MHNYVHTVDQSTIPHGLHSGSGSTQVYAMAGSVHGSQGDSASIQVRAVPGESHVMAELWNRSYGSTRSQVMMAADSLDRATV